MKNEYGKETGRIRMRRDLKYDDYFALESQYGVMFAYDGMAVED